MDFSYIAFSAVLQNKFAFIGSYSPIVLTPSHHWAIAKQFKFDKFSIFFIFPHSFIPTYTKILYFEFSLIPVKKAVVEMFDWTIKILKIMLEQFC